MMDFLSDRGWVVFALVVVYTTLVAAIIAYAVSRRAWETVKIISGGAWLAFLYVVSLWFAVGSLSTIQVREAAGQSADLLFDMESVSERVTNAEAVLLRKLDLTNMLPARDASEILERIQRSVGTEIQVAEFGTSEIFDGIVEQCSTAQQNNQVVCADVVSYYRTLLDAQSGFDSKVVDNYLAAMSGFSKSLADMRNGEVLFSLYDEYRFFSSIPGWKFFLEEPSVVLILQLAIAMGMLGSVVTMTWSFARQDHGLTVRRFIILPLVGSMSAMVVLVFLKAGQITMTSSGPGQTTNPLDPFFVSFIGIISGLVSERAYGWIAGAGDRVFGPANGAPRWGIGLEAALDEAGVSADDLAKFADMTPKQAVLLVDQEAPATPEQQRLISAFLRRSPRDLFTDLPPENTLLPVSVPELVGKPVADAEEILSAAKLKLGTQRQQSSPQTAGLVLSQNPEAGVEVPRFGSVDIVVSSGAGAS